MQDQVVTRIQQARIHIRTGSVDRAIALLEQARAMASGDRQVLPVIVRELVDAYRLVGNAKRADVLAEELTVLAPATSTSEVDLQPVEPNSSRRLLWVGGVLGCLLLVALGVIVWMWSGRLYAPVPTATTVHNVPSPSAASPLTPTNVPAAQPTAATAVPFAGTPQPSGPQKKVAKASDASGNSSRETLIHGNVGFLLHVAKYQGSIDGGQCQLEIPVGAGTCFAVSPNGIMLTNKHVTALDLDAVPSDCSVLNLPFLVRRSVRIVVCMGAKPSEHFEAKVVHESSRYDLALIRINKTFDGPLTLAGVRPSLSQPVYAVGFPGVVANVLQETNADQVGQQLSRAAASGFVSFTNWFSQDTFEPTLTRGIVSTTERRMDGASYIQVDAAVSEGNSGGPLLTENNEVVGICSSKVAGMDSYSFALSIPQLRSEIDKVLRQP